MNKRDAKSNDKCGGIQNTGHQLGNDNDLFHFLIEDSVLPIVFFSTTGVITYTNQSFAKMIGCSQSEIINESLFLFVRILYDNTSDRSFFINLIKRLSKKDKTLEIQFSTRIGEHRWVAIESLTYKEKTVNCKRFIQCIFRDITQEKKLQVELDNLKAVNQVHTKMLVNLIENTEGHIVVRKIDNKITWANNRFLETFGFTSENIIGKTELNLWPAKVQKQIRIATRVAIRNKERNTIELFIANKGKQVTILMTIFPMFDELGEVVSTGVIATDITQLKFVQSETEKAYTIAENSRKLLYNFIENASTPIYSTDIDYRIINANNALADWYGMQKEELYGKTPEELDTITGIEINKAISEANRQVVENQLPVNFDCCLLQSILNKTIYVNCTVFPLFSDDGMLAGTGTIMSDITQFVEHKHELVSAKSVVDMYKLKAEYHEYLLQSYIDNIPDYISILNLEGNVEFINKYAANLWEDSKENIVNKHYSEYIKNDRFLQSVSEELEFVINEQKYVETEDVFSYKGKEDIVLLSTIFPLFNKNGILFAIGIFRKDITDRKHLEFAREQLLSDARKQQELLSYIMDCAPDFISIKDIEHRYVMMNRAFAKNFQISNDFIGKNDLELGFSEELVKGNAEKGILGFWAENSQVIDSGQPKSIPLESITINGIIMNFRTTKIPLKDDNGIIWAVLTFSHNITADIQNSEALRESKELFQTLYNSTPAMLYSIDADGSIVNVSDYWLKVMGYEREEVIGQKLSSFVTEESLRYSREVVWALFLENGTCFNEEFQFVKKNGEIITCLLSAFAQTDSTGQLVTSLEVLVDITELRIKEMEVVDSKQLVTDFLNNIPYSAMILDLEQHYVMMNDNTANLYNATKEELIGLNYTDIVFDPKNAKKLNEIYTYVVEQQKAVEDTWSLNLRTGKSILIKSHTFPIYNSNSKMTHVGCIVNDISEQIRRERELERAKKASEKSKQLLNSFMDNATTAMFAKSMNGFYILKNRKKKQYDSLRNLERNNNRLNTVYAYDSELSRVDDARVIAQCKPMTFYDNLLREDGSLIYTETVKFPIYDKNNELIGVGGITKDITDSVIREMELEDAKQKAEDAANSQERFLASMSHDMRTPLNGVVGMINLLEQTPMSAEQKEYIEAMKVSSYNLRVLINDILDVSKIQAGKLNVECVLFDLNEILIYVNNVFSNEASKKGVVFSIELQHDTPIMLEGDPARLSQILTNLIGNALKFTAEGFVKLRVLYQNLADNKVNIEFIVEDSGIGISEEGLSKLFQPFVQASPDITRKFGGSGLGLSICKSLVELQQGVIGVNSTLGKGSVFSFNITYVKARQAEIENAKKINSLNKTVSDQPLSPLHCLVFEDNLINQMVAFHTLKKIGITSDMANNGKIGVEILKKDAILYDFVLMDIQMPEMDGYEATTVIRNELGLKIPIVAVTASALKGEKERCIEAGMNDFIPKPFVIDELIYIIRKLAIGNQKEEFKSRLSNEDTHNEITYKALKKIEFGDEPLYDISNVLEMEDDNFTVEILNTFLDMIPKALEELKTGIFQTADWEMVTKVAHKLKGGVGVLQMNEMILQLSTIEMNSRNRENLEQLPGALDVCFQIYYSVKDEITKLRDESMSKM